jgi:hypothetical protein
MLFDLRGRGRRRTVQVIYVTLALLMGGGLVLFGIGGATSGGLVDALGGGSGGGGGGQTVSKQISQVEKRLKTNPADAPSWALLARLRFQDATQTGYDQATSTFTAEGKQELAGVRTAWQRYLALNPAKPDADTALLMVQALGPSGLAANADAVKAMEIVLAQRPETSGLYVQYATLAYAAGQTRKGDLAAGKAVDLAPKDQRTALKNNLEAAKKAATSTTSGAAPATATTG